MASFVLLEITHPARMRIIKAILHGKLNVDWGQRQHYTSAIRFRGRPKAGNDINGKLWLR